ncbi:hypothetical protein QLX08_006701 [Tetragonisca angustula]|uniref:Uncharacterized protein n=1 Tax=Tetragonisca angustula TaxID=166442 RepID=A0AAW0ZT99_9HYME
MQQAKQRATKVVADIKRKTQEQFQHLKDRVNKLKPSKAKEIVRNKIKDTIKNVTAALDNLENGINNTLTNIHEKLSQIGNHMKNFTEEKYTNS